MALMVTDSRTDRIMCSLTCNRSTCAVIPTTQKRRHYNAIQRVLIQRVSGLYKHVLLQTNTSDIRDLHRLVYKETLTITLSPNSDEHFYCINIVFIGGTPKWLRYYYNADKLVYLIRQFCFYIYNLNQEEIGLP